jgi:FMN phosphatase YigB (HAD superfamily)
VGVAKPDAGIYLHAIEKLGIPPGEALFIDNLEENIRAAEAAGLHGIVFRNMEQLARDLKLRGFNIPLPQTVSLV